MSRTIPAYRPQVAWSQALVGVFRSDISLTDGPDVTPGSFGLNVYDDLYQPISIEIERGRAIPWHGADQGWAEVMCSDPDGIYDPTNEDSPLYGLLSDGRPMRIYMDHAGGTALLWYGYVSRVEHRPELAERVSIIRGVDFFEWLAGIKPVIASTGPTTIGAAIGLILDAAEWTDPSMRSLEDGNSIPDFSADGSATGLALISDLVKVDLGFPFVSKEGVFTYYSRGRMLRRQEAVDTFGSDVQVRARPILDGRQIVNRQTVTRTGGLAQTAENNPGWRPWREGAAITSDYLNTDSEALSLAQWIVAYSGVGIDSIPVELGDWDDTQIARIAARDLAEVVDVALPWGGTASTVIHGLRHRIVQGGETDQPSHLLTARVAQRPATFFTTDISLTDGPDVTGY